MYMVIQAINVIGDVLSVFFATPNLIDLGSSIKIVFPFMFFIIFGVLLWYLSDRVSVMMVKGETQSNEIIDIKANDIQRISFSILGLFFLGNSLPKLVSTLTNIYLMRDQIDFTDSTIRLLVGAIGAITQLIIGLGIFLGSQGLINFLNCIRTAGLKRADNYEEKE
jgi:hypothetical protein